MSKLLLKDPEIIKPRSLHIAAAAINAASILGIEQTVITSGSEGCHTAKSKHYTGEALDFRTKHLSPEIKQEWIKLTLRRLGAGFQGFIENEGGLNEHAHFEFDPKGE